MDTNLQSQLKNYSSNNSKKKYIYMGIILLIFGAIFYYFFLMNATKKDDASLYNTKKVTRGDLSVTVSATGTLNPTNSVDIGVEVCRSRATFSNT
jgi:HlyD family secretion protein